MVNPVKVLEKYINGSSQKDAAKKLGFSEAYLSMVLLGRKPPARKLLAKLGLERRKVVTYRRVR